MVCESSPTGPPSYLKAIEVPFLTNEPRVAKAQHRNSYASTYRQLRVSMSNRPCDHMLMGRKVLRGTCTSVREVDGNFQVPFLTPGDYDLTVGVPPRLLQLIGAKKNIYRSGPAAQFVTSASCRD